MGPEEPHSFTGLFELCMKIPHQGYERACTAVSSDNRSPIRTTEWIFGVVGQGSGEETPVEIEEI